MPLRAATVDPEIRPGRRKPNQGTVIKALATI